MRKYRYGDPTQHGFFRKYGNFLYFFATWNLFGIVLWKVMGAQKKASDEDWDKKSGTDKYLALTGIGDRVQRVKIQGLTKVEDDHAKDTSAE